MDWLVGIRDMAWPIVALVCIYYLGHKGLLKQLFEIIGEKIIEVGRTLKAIKEESLTIKSNIDELMASLNSFSNKLEESKKLADGFRDYSNKLNETQDLLDEAIVVLSDREESAQEPSGIDSVQDVHGDALYKKIMEEWDVFVSSMENAFVNTTDFDRRSISVMARRLADGRVRLTIERITKAEAESIAAVFARIKAIRRSWSRVSNKESEAESIIADINSAANMLRQKVAANS
ncbi:MAG: hypothetical protein HQL38_06250 [Alphaproteobacteria bacterium]|nr:hypothetical protein [Alphaproteobacteria bacterium]